MSLQGYNPYTYTAGFRNQEFHHAVLSVSGTWHTLYLDGVQVAQNLSGGNVFASYQTITNTVIGAQTTLAQAFQGTIGDVRVYNYAIPQTLVTSLYRDRNLVVYYPFDSSVNNLTPNYASLVYDASLIGQPLITASSGANVGSGALALTNSATTAATQYVKTTPGIAGQIGWNMNAANGITIACWINVAGVAGRVQRIFDIPLSVNSKGLGVDISGTNMIYSVWNGPELPVITTGLAAYFSLNNTTKNSVSGLTVTAATTVTYATTGGRTGLVCTDADYSSSSTNIITNVNIPTLNLVGTGTGYSFSFWLYQNTVNATTSVCFSIMNSSLSGFQVQAYNGILFFSYGFNGSNNGGAINCNGPLSNLAWNHVVFVVNSNQTTSLYINNVNVSNNANVYPSSMSIGSGNKIGIGCDNDYSRGGWTGTGRVYNGYVSKVAFYSTPLSAAQVTTLYNAG